MPARPRHQEFLAFLRCIDKAVPAELDVHLHRRQLRQPQASKVRAWLVERPRWHMHFVPTYSSWLDQVERCIAISTSRAIRRGSFGSVKGLPDRIDRFVKAYNTSCKPFIWTATAESILEKLARLCGRINGAGQ